MSNFIVEKKIYRKSAVYLITNLNLGKFYVGATKNAYTRSKNHQYTLEQNRHMNACLQDDFNLGHIFKLEVLEYCGVENLGELESFWIDELGPLDELYNTLNRKHGGLTDDEIIYIRQQARNGRPYKDIANDIGYGVAATRHYASGRFGQHLDHIEPPVKKRAKAMSDEIVTEARRRFKGGETIASLVHEFKVNYDSLRLAIYGERFKHLNEQEAPAQRRVVR